MSRGAGEGSRDSCCCHCSAIKVLHADVTQFAEVALGIPPGSPACVQSVARGGAKMPDHACPYGNVVDNINVKIGGKDANGGLIYLWPLTGTFWS